MATLTTENGYLKYVTVGATKYLPLQILANCTFLEYTDKIVIVLPSETNAHQKSFIEILPTDALTTVSAILAYLQTIQQTVLNTEYARIIQTDATYTYVAEATAGSLAASAVWRAKRIETATGTTTWADSNTNFDNVATTLSGLNYF